MSKSTKGRKRVMFEIHAEPGSKVFVAGTFNNWKPTEKPLKEKGKGVYSRALMLPKGEHEYKFVVNGSWCVDPDCPQFVQSELGCLNSVVSV